MSLVRPPSPLKDSRRTPQMASFIYLCPTLRTSQRSTFEFNSNSKKVGSYDTWSSMPSLSLDLCSRKFSAPQADFPTIKLKFSSLACLGASLRKASYFGGWWLKARAPWVSHTAPKLWNRIRFPQGTVRPPQTDGGFRIL